MLVLPAKFLPQKANGKAHAGKALCRLVLNDILHNIQHLKREYILDVFIGRNNPSEFLDVTVTSRGDGDGPAIKPSCKPVPLSKHNRRPPLKCPECPQTLLTRGKLDKHLSIGRHQKGCKWKCHFCENRYATSSALQGHLKWHVPDTNTICPLPGCGKGLRTRLRLLQHLVKDHDCSTDRAQASAGERRHLQCT